MLLRQFLLAAGLCWIVAAAGQPVQTDTKAIMAAACKEAAASGRQVFVIFHASWCGWCHKMDSSINDASCKKLFDDNYVIRHLVVQESKSKQHLETPGALELMHTYHADEQGLPFWMIFDKNGKMIADSRVRKPGEGPEAGDNAGCPASAEEVAFFLEVLRKTSHLTESQLAVIATRFRKNESRH